MKIAVRVKGKTSFYLIFFGVYLLSAMIAVSAQTADPDAQRREELKAQERNQKAIDAASNPLGNRRTETTDFEEAQRNRRKTLFGSRAGAIAAMLREERKRLAASRAPNSEDLAKYKQFLKQSKTGIFRLFPDLGCEEKNLVRADGDCANAVSFSSAYSFRREDYVEPDYSDFRLKDGNLIADAFLAQDILVSLGDTPFENVSLANQAVKFLVDFKPETQIWEAKKQFSQIAAGIESNGYRYGKSARAEVNTTYAARIVAYESNRKHIARLSPLTMTDDEKKFSNLQNDKRLDLTIAFRIIRKDADGNVTILWRELARQKAPKIILLKDEKITDIK